MKNPRGILMGVAAVAVGIGVAAAGIGYLLRSVPTADAADGIGPTATGGVPPWVSVSGVTDAVANDTIAYTVPVDRILVLTGGCVSGTTASLHEDGVEKMHYGTRLFRCDDVTSAYDNGPSLMRNGNATIVFQPGTDVVIHHDVAQARNYYLQGHLARP